MDRRTWLANTAALSLGGVANTLSAVEKSESFRFVFLTDPHIQPEKGASEGVRQCFAKVNECSPAFVITGGDLIMDALDVGPTRVHEQWRLWDEAVKTLQPPVLHTVGNHDVAGWSSKGIIKPGDADYGKKLFQDRYGAGRTYRSFDHGGWHFVLLDSIGQNLETLDYQGWIDDEQLAWLQADLQAVGRKTPVVLVSHIPFVSVWHQLLKGPAFPLDAKALVGNAYKLREWLKGFNVRLVLSGHGHLYERIELGNVTYLQGGAVSGLWWKGRVNGDPEGFLEIECHANGTFVAQHRDYGWKVRA